MKIFFDLLPVILFFIAYKMFDIYVATGVIIVACLVQLIAVRLVTKRVEKVYIWTCLAVVLLGGLTIWLRDPMFIKWKPSIVNWGLGLAFLISQFVGEKPLVERMLGKALEMPREKWKRLNFAWILFFLACGSLNIFIAYRWSESAWVNFKLFGLTGLSFAFIIIQMALLRAHIKEPEEAEKEPAT
jgi:intracellular septation protein